MKRKSKPSKTVNRDNNEVKRERRAEPPRVKKSYCFSSCSPDHSVKQCTMLGKGPKCFSCNTFGHISKECKKRVDVIVASEDLKSVSVRGVFEDDVTVDDVVCKVKVHVVPASAMPYECILGENFLSNVEIIIRGGKVVKMVRISEGEGKGGAEKGAEATHTNEAVVLGKRKSKSESSLLPKKKVLSSRSFNVTIPLSATEKMNEAIEIRKSSGNSTCEETEKENKFQTEFKEEDAENLTNSHKYKFGSTYRSLNDSFSVSSSSIRSENLLLEDFSSDGLEHTLYEFKRPVLMAPSKLQLLLHKVTSLSKEPCLTQGNFNEASNNTLIENTKSECNHEPKQDEITENFEEGCSIKRNCNIVNPDSYLNDIDKEIYSINGETYLIDKSRPNRYDKTSMYFNNVSNVDQESNTEIHVPAAYSTPMRIDSKDGNLLKMKYRNDQNDNYESLLRKFANLNISKRKVPIFKIYEDPLKEMKVEDECIENVDVGNKSNTLSISLSNFEIVVHTYRKENSSKYSVINIAQKNNTEEEINSANDKSKKKIVPTSSDGENQINFHELLDL
ncbi:hypothetical protein M0804_014641 [Polistes exclamans]|nr:hypothetical protein M0804_014641 [Polistes exclamans]